MRESEKDRRKKGTREEERKREREKEENETVSAERRCVAVVSAEAFDIFSQGEDLDSCGGFSCGELLGNLEDLFDCESETRTDVPAVPVVIDVLVCFPFFRW